MARNLAGLSLRGQAAQMLAVDLADLRSGSSVADSLEAVMRGHVLSDSVGSVLVRGGELEELSRVLGNLQRAARVPLLTIVPLERGAGGTLRGATELPMLSASSVLLDPKELREAGRAAAREARFAGAHMAWVRAGPYYGPASLAAERAAAGTAGYLEGLAQGGMLTAVTAFPVHLDPGAREVPVAAWDRAWLESGELPFLREALGAGIGGMVLESVALPALTGDTVPLALAAASRGFVRRDLGYEGLMMADLRPDGVLVRAYGAHEAAVRAVAAGTDLLLGVTDVAGTLDALLGAVAAGRLPRSRLEESSRRVLRAKAAAGLHRAGSPVTRPSRPHRAAPQAVEWFLRSSLPLGWNPPLPAASEATLLVTAEGEGEELASALRRHLPRLRHLAVNPAQGAGALRDSLAAALAGVDRVLYAEFPGSQARLARRLQAALGAAGGRHELIELRFVASEADLLPTAAEALAVWGAGPEAQQAMAQRVAGRGAAAGSVPDRMVWPPARTLRQGAAAEAGMSEAGLARVDALLQRAAADELFPGAALAVARRGVLVRLRGYGRLSRDPDAPAADAHRSLYDLASLTKVVGTTAAAMVLLEEGRIELDAPVSRYLPGFNGEDREAVTVRQLLSHTAGLPAGLALHGATSPAAALERLIGARLVLDPGAVPLYSDVGMIVLGEALDRAAGEPLDRLLARRVFRPLGMQSTLYLPPLALRHRTAPTAQTSPEEFELQGIVHDGTAFRLGGIAGHAGLFSTAHDLAVFAQTLLNGGAYGVQRVFQPVTVETFRQRQPRAQERALGWDTPAPESSAGSYFSARSFGHTGFTGTSLWIDPEKDLFVVLLTNRTYDRTSLLRMLELRARVHDAVARAITDAPVTRRPGAVDVIPPPTVRPVAPPPQRPGSPPRRSPPQPRRPRARSSPARRP